MDNNLKSIFLSEIEKQCNFALISCHNLNAALHQNNNEIVWYSVQSFLVAAGNISKLLWPDKETTRKNLIPNRGQILRDALSVKSNSILAPRTFRNHFEHYDQRIEEWATSSKRNNMVDSSIFPPGSIQGIDKEDYLRNLDPTTMTLSFRGNTYQLQPLADEISDLLQKVKVYTNIPYWQWK